MVWPDPPEWGSSLAAPGLAVALAAEFHVEFRGLGPLWLRADPSGWLWMFAPLSVLVVSSPASLLRVAVALLVAVGVGVALRWQSVVSFHQHLCERFVDGLALRVAAVMVQQLPHHLVEEASKGWFRDELRGPILQTARKHAGLVSDGSTP